eukprot:Mrub_07147.p1 GENE.Mrub_07147~~Mrub_07147.p1  ORF type:complete len:299 (+),score=66.49 Mrub_07147:1-897(+)
MSILTREIIDDIFHVCSQLKNKSINDSDVKLATYLKYFLKSIYRNPYLWFKQNYQVDIVSNSDKQTKNVKFNSSSVDRQFINSNYNNTNNLSSNLYKGTTSKSKPNDHLVYIKNNTNINLDEGNDADSREVNNASFQTLNNQNGSVNANMNTAFINKNNILGFKKLYDNHEDSDDYSMDKSDDNINLIFPSIIRKISKKSELIAKNNENKSRVNVRIQDNSQNSMHLSLDPKMSFFKNINEYLNQSKEWFEKHIKLYHVQNGTLVNINAAKCLKDLKNPDNILSGNNKIDLYIESLDL